MNPRDLVVFHPAWQVACTLLGLYVAWLGLKRFRSLHLGQKVAFPRARHALLGKVALVGLLLGMAGGAIMVRWLWHNWLVTGVHGWLGLAAAALNGLAHGKLGLKVLTVARRGVDEIDAQIQRLLNRTDSQRFVHVSEKVVAQRPGALPYHGDFYFAFAHRTIFHGIHLILKQLTEKI